MTSGIVSNTARPVRSGSTNDAVYLAVQTDAAINPATPAVRWSTSNGDIVGINSSIAARVAGAAASPATSASASPSRPTWRSAWPRS